MDLALNFVSDKNAPVIKGQNSTSKAKEMADRHIDRGDDLYKMGFSGAAEAEYRIALLVDPENIGALLELAKIYQEKGDLDSVGKFVKKAYEIDPESANTIGAMGGYYFLTGDHNKAVDYLNKAVEMGSDNSACYCNLGSIFLIYAFEFAKRGQHRDAEEFTREAADLLFKAYELNPHNDVLLANLASLMTRLPIKNNPLPEYFLRRAIIERPSNNNNWINLSAITQRPIPELQAELKISKYHLRMARFGKFMGDYKLAAIESEFSLRFFGMFPENLIEHAEISLLAYKTTGEVRFLASAEDALKSSDKMLYELLSFHRDVITKDMEPLKQKNDDLLEKVKEERSKINSVPA